MSNDHPQDGGASGASDGETTSENLPVTADDESAGVPARLGIWFVSAYRKYISPALPPSCRYRPTCSEYTIEAIRRYGLVKGGWLGIKRISRCHPFHDGGHDPVP